LTLLILPLLLIVVHLGAQGGPPPEPRNGRAYFGFTQPLWDSQDPVLGDQRLFSYRWADTLRFLTGGKTPSLYAIPTIWQSASGSMVPFSSLQWQLNLMASKAPNAIPMITWNAQTGWSADSASYAGITTKSVNSGLLDAYITSYAEAVKAYGKPVFIRPICGEVNGSWWRNCSPKANPALTKQDYIYAFQRVADIFRKRGATNVAWLWNLNTFPPNANWNIDADIKSYYPGDAFVTWVSVDHYDYGPASWLDPEVDFAQQKGKPVYVAEWGVRHSASKLTPTGQQAWLESMFSYFESHSTIKAVQYYDYNSSPADPVTDHAFIYNRLVNFRWAANDNDHRLITESGASLRATVSAHLSSDRYQ
jgi:hypothetical protein